MNRPGVPVGSSRRRCVFRPATRRGRSHPRDHPSDASLFQSPNPSARYRSASARRASAWSRPPADRPGSNRDCPKNSGIANDSHWSPSAVQPGQLRFRCRRRRNTSRPFAETENPGTRHVASDLHSKGHGIAFQLKSLLLKGCAIRFPPRMKNNVLRRRRLVVRTFQSQPWLPSSAIQPAARFRPEGGVQEMLTVREKRGHRWRRPSQASSPASAVRLSSC